MAPTAGQDPALNMNHPFYDVARHGILQVAGESLLGGPQEHCRCQPSCGPCGTGWAPRGCFTPAWLGP